MQNTMKVNDDVTVGPQPTEDEIRNLSSQGFKSVVNFRTDSEEEQPLSPEAEGETVRSAGMQYLNFPVSMKSLDAGHVDRFRELFSKLPKPVYAHCKIGKRAGAMTMMHIACENNLTGEQTLQKAEKMGFECDQQELIDFVKQYVNDRSSQS